MSRDQLNNTSKTESWILASRPKTLLAAVVPVLVGSALAENANQFHPVYSLIALICSLLIQAGTNLTNDLYDHLKGSDTPDRKGPQRVISSGLISIRQMKIAITITFFTAFLLGLYLVYVGGIVILIIGVVSIIAGLAYTAGPYPLAYNGLGDIFVFTFFGIVGTAGTYFLHTGEFTAVSFLVSIPVGALITDILVVNNYRDIEEDKASGKLTLAVKFGAAFTRYQFIFLIALSFITPIVLYFYFNFSVLIFLPYLTLPFAVILIRMLYTLKGIQLNKTLELTAQMSALYGLLFSAGIIL